MPGRGRKPSRPELRGAADTTPPLFCTPAAHLAACLPHLIGGIDVAGNGVGIAMIAWQDQFRTGAEIVEILAQYVAVEIVDFGPAGGFSQFVPGHVEERVAFANDVDPLAGMMACAGRLEGLSSVGDLTRARADIGIAVGQHVDRRSVEDVADLQLV